ncbi:unnamed protein product [Rhizophagus irregularis]|uniref:Uncharacterized protein n=1 Tax=Rhizophagus irregularis TaxID=588596 RepID=A0A916E993_9GLOM|nr:unnamed protein product [Rhizophagus irregularis]CAB5198311.1 unnamed protein product [Rhizophagus irregularis]CAB5369350.1 unnamed protein product [Rhizophagus irregularis]
MKTKFLGDFVKQENQIGLVRPNQYSKDYNRICYKPTTNKSYEIIQDSRLSRHNFVIVTLARDDKYLIN